MPERPAIPLDGTPPSRPLSQTPPAPPTLPGLVGQHPDHAPVPRDPYAAARRLLGALILKLGCVPLMEDS